MLIAAVYEFWVKLLTDCNVNKFLSNMSEINLQMQNSEAKFFFLK